MPAVLTRRQRRDSRAQQVNKGLFGLRCCCVIAAHNDGDPEEGKTIVTPCCGKRLVYQGGAWGRGRVDHGLQLIQGGAL
jgi:hypothetical protein